MEPIMGGTQITMTGSKMSLEEYQAKAMLMGMIYDPRDHTFTANAYERDEIQCFDPDTMQELSNTHNTFKLRVDAVDSGRIGPSWLSGMDFEVRGKIWMKSNGFAGVR